MKGSKLDGICRFMISMGILNKELILKKVIWMGF